MRIAHFVFNLKTSYKRTNS